jgi:hypothetical protein
VTNSFHSRARAELEEAMNGRKLVALYCFPGQLDVFVVGYPVALTTDRCTLSLVDPDGLVADRAFSFEIADVARLVTGSRYLRSLELLSGLLESPRVVEHAMISMNMAGIRQLLSAVVGTAEIVRLQLTSQETLFVRPITVTASTLEARIVRFDDGLEDGLTLIPLALIEEAVRGTREEITLRHRWRHRDRIGLDED